MFSDLVEEKSFRKILQKKQSRVSFETKGSFHRSPEEKCGALLKISLHLSLVLAIQTVITGQQHQHHAGACYKCRFLDRMRPIHSKLVL